MDFLYYGVASSNGYDATGHYLRAQLLVNLCSTYNATANDPSCTANFRAQEDDEEEAEASAARGARAGRRPRALPVGAPAAPVSGAPARPAAPAPAPGAGARRDGPDAREHGEAHGLPAGRRLVRRRRSSRSIAANPTLIGAATVLVIVVAVFLAYNANSGLPFVPAYSLTAEVPSGAQLVAGNEVRLGGARVGVVETIRPRRLRSGRVIAELGMKLETTVQPLPTDSTILVRPRSALGLKYVELTRGTAAQGFADGATIPLRQATPAPVEFDEALSAFDERTREASRRNLTEFGNALAGPRRGPQRRPREPRPAAGQPRAGHAQPVRPADAARRARGGARRDGAPGGARGRGQASLFRNLDTTFGGLAAVREDLRRASRRGPRRSTRASSPSRASGRSCATPSAWPPSSRRAPRPCAAPRPSSPARSRRAPRRCGGPSSSTRAWSRPSWPSSASRRTRSPASACPADRAQPHAGALVAQVAPAQTVCNYATNLLRNASSLLSEGDQNGTGQRFIIIATPQGPNNEGGPSSAPATGRRPTTTCTATRTRTPPRRASRASARRATRPTTRAAPSWATTRATRARRSTARRGEPAGEPGPHAAQGPRGRQPARRRPARARGHLRRHVLRLRQDDPVPARLPGRAVFESANSIRPGLARADRRA
jgi:hypothetical protein